MQAYTPLALRVKPCVTDNPGMDALTFGRWLKDTREAHGYSQGELGALIGMKRTYVNALENDPRKWPKPVTRARFHAVFGTSDEDLVAAGAATRKVYPRPSGGERVVYLPAPRGAGTAPPAPVMPSLDTVPPAVAELLAAITWTPETTQAVAMLLEGVASRERRLSEAAASSPDTPRPVPRRTGAPT